MTTPRGEAAMRADPRRVPAWQSEHAVGPAARIIGSGKLAERMMDRGPTRAYSHARPARHLVMQRNIVAFPRICRVSPLPPWHFHPGSLARLGKNIRTRLHRNRCQVPLALCNMVQALDLTDPDNPKQIWNYVKKTDRDEFAVSRACCDTVNRGGSYADGKFVFGTLDGFVIALNGQTVRKSGSSSSLGLRRARPSPRLR